MPEICRFYGIVIKMFFKPKEHEPSHLHALYGEHVGIFDLQTMEMTGPSQKGPGVGHRMDAVEPRPSFGDVENTEAGKIAAAVLKGVMT